MQYILEYDNSVVLSEVQSMTVPYITEWYCVASCTSMQHMTTHPLLLCRSSPSVCNRLLALLEVNATLHPFIISLARALTLPYLSYYLPLPDLTICRTLPFPYLTSPSPYFSLTLTLPLPHPHLTPPFLSPFHVPPSSAMFGVI